MKKLFFFLAALTAPALLFSQTDGTTDYNFGGGNITENYGEAETFQQIVVQPDGRILAGMWSAYNNISVIVLYRYNTDGTRDNTFGNGGELPLDIDPTGISEVNMAMGPGGKIYVATSQGNAYGPLYVLRLNSDGTPDNSFGNNGTVVDSFSIEGQHIDALTVQSDGKVLVAGLHWTTTPSYSWDFFVMRYNTNGTRDNTFGTNGVKVLDYTSLISGGTGDADYVSRIVQQPDGKILLGGKYRNTNQQLDDWAFCRLNPDGTPDASFGINGALIAGMQYKEMVTGMGLQDDGSIIAGGGCGNGYTDFRIFKVNSNGTMNTTFGTAVTGMGWGYTALVAETFTNHTVTDLAVLPDDKIIVAGGVGFSHGLVVRYLPDGTYDPTFAGDGQYDTIPSGPVNLSITAMAVDTLRGRIYVGGYYSDPDLGTGVAWIKGLHNGPGQPFGLPQEHSVKFTLWPNPANDIVTISGENIQELELTDLSGRIIYRSSTPGTQQIALEQFPSGIYCVRVYTDSGIAVQKLVKK